MERKFYTFLIFPGAHGKLRKLRMPFYVVHMVLALSVVGVMTMIALANSYARMLLKVSNYNSLRTEREALKTQYRSLENVVTQTNAKLGSLQSLAAEVALSYGFGEPRRPRFPLAVLSLATQSNSTVDSSFQASLYAFNLMKAAATNVPLEPLTQSLLTDPRFERTTVPTIWPVRGRVTAGFGQRMDPLSGEGAFHAGLDISSPYGSAVEAAADGLVFHAGPDAGYGNAVLVDHGYGIHTKYSHLSRISVVMGQEVKRGQLVGAVGATGRTTGPHLHYEVRVNETPVNPSRYLRR
ncbi:MAG: M23 family metallopeptidase [Acidobacteria bacterium]|nr:M23 family metallopeptidase [Acidobacteriota bacterium]